MKVLVVLALAVASLNLVIADDATAADVCEEELKNDQSLKDAPLKEKIMCFYSCSAHKQGLTDDQGHYVPERIESYLNLSEPLSDKQKEQIKKCNDKYSDSNNVCEQFWNTTICVNDVVGV